MTNHEDVAGGGYLAPSLEQVEYIIELAMQVTTNLLYTINSVHMLHLMALCTCVPGSVCPG